MLPGDVPGILGAVDEGLSLAAIAALVRAMATRLHVQPGLKAEIDPSPVVPACSAASTQRLLRGDHDPQGQERLGLDALDQVQLRDADGWLVCTEKAAPAAVAVHVTPVDTLIPGKASQGPE